MRETEIVQFANGKFGVREEFCKGNYRFYGLHWRKWWSIPEFVERYCMGTYKEALEAYNSLDLTGTPVKICTGYSEHCRINLEINVNQADVTINKQTSILSWAKGLFKGEPQGGVIMKELENLTVVRVVLRSGSTRRLEPQGFFERLVLYESSTSRDITIRDQKTGTLVAKFHGDCVAGIEVI